MIAGKKFAPKGITNETAIETRVIDVEQPTQHSLVSQLKKIIKEEEKKRETRPPVKAPTPKRSPNILGEDHEDEDEAAEWSSDPESDNDEIDKFMEQEEELLIEGARLKNRESSSSEDEDEQFLDEEEEFSDHEK